MYLFIGSSCYYLILLLPVYVFAHFSLPYHCFSFRLIMCAQFFSDFISVGNVTGQIVGLPPSFIQTYKMAGDFTLPVQAPSYNHKPLKNPEVPELDSYLNNPGEEFWKLFPFVPLQGTIYLNKNQDNSAPPSST